MDALMDERTLYAAHGTGEMTIAPEVERQLELERWEGHQDRQGRLHDHRDPEYTGRVGCAGCEERLREMTK